MVRFGLVGRKLGHSFSKDYFTRLFAREGLADHRYDLFELDRIDRFPALLRDTVGLRGLNVTIPYKEAVIPYLDALAPLAAAVGAVNTVHIVDGRTIGYNTDVEGFRSLLDQVPIKDKEHDLRTRALLLGSGGASRAVAYVLREADIPFRVVSRSPTRGDLTWSLLEPTVVRVCKLIINATPVGMYPAVEEAPPLPYAALTPAHTLIDLVYNPADTRFLQQGRSRGARTIGGAAMLHAQAEAAWRIWQASA